jgi:hypothetical protein
MKQSEYKQRLESFRLKEEVESYEANLNRSRAIAVGTAFGGTTEVSMRGNGDKFLYCLMQPVEVIELIHQLAANVGCHIALKPREDFSSWREWRVSEAEKKHLNGQAPFVNDMAVFQQLGASNFDQTTAEQVVANNLAQKEYEYVNGAAVVAPKKRGVKNGKTLAVGKSTNKRNTK